MINETKSGYIFHISSVLLLIILLTGSRDAGITCDEVLHYNHSVAVYNYFASHGEDRSALSTPETHLKYYGQSFDNLVTILIKWFNIDDIYGFRHIMGSLAGWFVILLTALFAIWIAGYTAGLIVLVLFAVSPTFIGHIPNNLKDIPFALSYISGIFFVLKFISSGRKPSLSVILLLTASSAFSISIRAGGLILICYLYLFFLLFYIIKFLKYKQFDIVEIRTKLLWMIAISIVSWLLSILLWPFALQNPVKNLLEAYRAMAHFPATYRQIFEGKVVWSDHMPWYYLIKSMAITIPLIVTAGLVCFCFISKSVIKQGRGLMFAFILFTVLFPLIFVVYEKSNLYSSWRQFLFLYPVIILLAATGFYYFLDYIRNRTLKWLTIVLLAILSIHPLKFMLLNHPYSYLYYNQLVGGLQGAYGNYETDYYYVSQTQASEWLLNYLKDKTVKSPVIVKATYSVEWQFRNHPEIETSYFRYEERSQFDWDYAIVTNRYISPYQLKNKIWPPKNALHIVYADNVPICVVMERKSKDDFYGYTALSEGRSSDAIHYFEKSLKVDDKDEMIFYNFAAALYNTGLHQMADSILKRGLEINPDFEPILMYLGNIARSQNNKGEAIMYFERLINANRKYFEAYVGLAELLTDTDLVRARELLRRCLIMSPRYKPAIIAMADTYRKSDPEVAIKYDELANSIK